MDIFIIFLGTLLRFIFVYKFSNEKQKKAYHTNPGKEEHKDMLAGVVGTIVLFLLIVLILILTGNVSVPRDTIQVEKIK